MLGMFPELIFCSRKKYRRLSYVLGTYCLASLFFHSSMAMISLLHLYRAGQSRLHDSHHQRTAVTLFAAEIILSFPACLASVACCAAAWAATYVSSRAMESSRRVCSSSGLTGGLGKSGLSFRPAMIFCTNVLMSASRVGKRAIITFCAVLTGFFTD